MNEFGFFDSSKIKSIGKDISYYNWRLKLSQVFLNRNIDGKSSSSGSVLCPR